MAEESKMLSSCPKWFQSLDLKWLQPTGSHFPWYVTLSGFLDIAGGCTCCHHGAVTGELWLRDQEIWIHTQKEAVMQKGRRGEFFRLKIIPWIRKPDWISQMLFLGVFMGDQYNKWNHVDDTDYYTVWCLLHKNLYNKFFPGLVTTRKCLAWRTVRFFFSQINATWKAYWHSPFTGISLAFRIPHSLLLPSCVFLFSVYIKWVTLHNAFQKDP